MNPRLTKKDLALIKGALRRAFTRSELHKEVLTASIVQHEDPKRPKVKTWCKCEGCGRPEAKSYMQVDHIVPVVKIEEVGCNIPIDVLVNRIWCEKELLQILCKTCHTIKTQGENKSRRAYKKRVKCQIETLKKSESN